MSILKKTLHCNTLLLDNSFSNDYYKYTLFRSLLSANENRT